MGEVVYRLELPGDTVSVDGDTVVAVKELLRYPGRVPAVVMCLHRQLAGAAQPAAGLINRRRA